MRATTRKVAKGCARCLGLHRDGADEMPARYRALIDRYLCDSCYRLAIHEIEAETGRALTGGH